MCFDFISLCPVPAPFWISVRLGVSLLMTFGACCVYSNRVNLSVGIVCMVNHTATTPFHNATRNTSDMYLTSDPQCGYISENGSTVTGKLKV